jgi:hypothetical protein
MMRADEGSDVGVEPAQHEEREMLSGLPFESKISDEQNLCSSLQLQNYHTSQTE